MLEIWYLSEISAQVSQVVFLPDMTLLRLMTTLWPKISEISYLSKLSAQVSEIMFPADLTVLRLFTTVWHKISEI